MAPNRPPSPRTIARAAVLALAIFAFACSEDPVGYEQCPSDMTYDEDRGRCVSDWDIQKIFTSSLFVVPMDRANGWCRQKNIV